MSNLKFLVAALCATFVSLLGFTACSDDDDMLQFTKDEVIQGDILTGNQVPIPGNTIDVYATMSYSVNIQHAKGGVVAVSQNEDIATIQTVNDNNDPHPIIVVYGHKMGKTQVNVSDSEGHTATLTVNVLDEEDYWTTILTYSKISLVEDEVEITGVSEAEASKIRYDILSNKAKEAKFVLKASQSFPWPTYKMLVFDGSDALLYKLLYGVLGESDMKFRIINDKGETAKTYTFRYVSDESAGYLMEDISDNYKAQYPGAQVVLKMAVKKS